MKLPFAIGAIWLAACVTRSSAADQSPCEVGAPCGVVAYPVNNAPSWIFRRGTYTHDPYTAARVAQYMPMPPIEPLEDQRMVTSRYRRSRTNLRGSQGSFDTYYEVQAWGNGRGGIDAEWERVHDAWKESYLMGGYYNQAPGYGGHYGIPGYGYGYPGYGFPGGGYGGHHYPPHGHGGSGHHDDHEHGHGGDGHGGHGAGED